MRFRTVLVDDEPLALTRLERLLMPYLDKIDIVGRAQDGPEAVTMIDGLKPDLVFLDIQIPEVNGFEVLDIVEHTPLVIFSTAYDQYALTAFEANAIDYLLKPIEPERLEKAIDKLVRLMTGNLDPWRARLADLLHHFRPATTKRIKAKSGNHIHLIPISDIIFFRASAKLVECHTIDTDHLIDLSLKQLESQLPPEDFVRIHRSVIINMNYIDRISKMFNGTYQVRMKDKKKSQLPVSRNARSKLGLI
ncbi:MAG: LytTR family DNA-binding domain-containing protein [Myxococcota bacterium]|nr:LytTR family DNA-binding domain-containing protein [Myxococcota bacterium]